MCHKLIKHPHRCFQLFGLIRPFLRTVWASAGCAWLTSPWLPIHLPSSWGVTFSLLCIWYEYISYCSLVSNQMCFFLLQSCAKKISNTAKEATFEIIVTRFDKIRIISPILFVFLAFERNTERFAIVKSHTEQEFRIVIHINDKSTDRNDDDECVCCRKTENTCKHWSTENRRWCFRCCLISHNYYMLTAKSRCEKWGSETVSMQLNRRSQQKQILENLF